MKEKRKEERERMGKGDMEAKWAGERGLKASFRGLFFPS